MIRRITSIAVLAVLVGALVLANAAAAAPPTAAWKLTASSQPTNFDPGAGGQRYLFVATNVGPAPTSSSFEFTDTLPEGITPVSASGQDGQGNPISCSISAPTVTCTDPGPLPPGEVGLFKVFVKVNPLLADPSILTGQAKVSGGGAPSAGQTSTTTTVSSALPPFDFLPDANGLSASLVSTAGTPTSQAGSHPHQLTIDLAFPTAAEVGPDHTLIGPEGGLRDVITHFPRGLVGNPSATPVRCTEAELETESCPDASQVGNASALDALFGGSILSSNVYNMVPPFGSPAEFGFEVAGVGIFIHITTGVRPGDYAIFGTSKDILQRFGSAPLGVQVQLWGDPSNASHDHVRGPCVESGNAKAPPDDICSSEPEGTAFLAMPSDCSDSLPLQAEADSWGNAGTFHERITQFADPGGAAVEVQGCGGLDFKPSVDARPTTGVTDSPTGLDFDLKQPQDFDFEDNSTANLRDATVTFPAGITVNAAQADGLGVCSRSEIGLESGVGGTPVRFSGGPARCPAASKLGVVEVTTPLLAQYDADNRVLRDPEGNPIPQPLHGSVYLAKPFDNPFGSLIATYLTIDDPQTGIFVKLAGRGDLDPLTGRLTVTFSENPELPVEDVWVHLFTGPRAPLQTPPTCATYTTAADLTPWSAPEAPVAHATGDFTLTGAPGGGSCPATEGQLPNAPAFTAGTVLPRAGAYSPVALKLSREDGSQRFSRIDTTLPPGLVARLAGVPYCSEAQIAAARARSHPDEGALERESSSCPAASEIGVVNVGAGAGPTPLYVSGRIFLAGPYEGAPLSMVVITPAVAGPFDLGAVVVRVALHVDPETARVRAVSDPLPTILQGVPIDVRSATVRVARPRFALNPTSCDPTVFSGAVTSTLGQVAPLAAPFQVGGCRALGFKPRLSFRLKGKTKRTGHPALRAVVTYPKGAYANIARAQVALPRSEFLDNAHIQTICTRVQFAADRCPAGAVYGHATAITPLLDAPLSGPVYLRSSSHELPDLVADLKGQIEVVLDGRIDSINGGIRTTFEAVPDAPVSKFVLEMKGGKKGLLINSTNLCRTANRATAKFDAQNGKTFDSRPLLKADCGSRRNKRGGRR